MVFKFHAPSFSDHNLEEYPMVLRKFDLGELQAATGKFSGGNILARGIFGRVYRGLLPGGSLVAVKRLANDTPDMEARFRTEIRIGSNYMARHPNVLHLIGFCHMKAEHLLVYPLLEDRRSLACCLRKIPKGESVFLDWAMRKKIAVGVAYGLAHLHSGTDLVYQEICSSNIWLDDEFNPVIADFGLNLVAREKDLMDDRQDSPQENDVRAYGSILLILICGVWASDVNLADGDNVGFFLVDSVKRALMGHPCNSSAVIDPGLNGNYDTTEVEMLLYLGLLCMQRCPAKRPKMSEVVKLLEERGPVAIPSFNEDLLDCFTGNLLPKRFSLDELRVATGKFRTNNLLAEGGFSTVFWGKLSDGSVVAVKRLDKNVVEHAERQFETEVMISSKRMEPHPNLLHLIGFCHEASESLLVYPLMINKSLEHHLRRGRDKIMFPPLDWATRKRIALGAARGIAHLHDNVVPPIIHRDICPSNILLDMAFEAVVGDFGWALLLNDETAVDGTVEWSFRDELPFSPHLYRDTYVNTSVRGTDGYIASEYKNTGKCSQKSDVFAFGNLLVELITGQKAINFGRVPCEDLMQVIFDNVERDLDGIVDEELNQEYNRGEAKHLIGIAKMCIHRNPSMRPKMRDVVRKIEGI